MKNATGGKPMAFSNSAGKAMLNVNRMVRLPVLLVKRVTVMPEKVQCVRCRFLKLRRRDTGDLEYADDDYRNDGFMPIVFVPSAGQREKYEAAPCCEQGVDLKSEMNGDDREAGFSVASDERLCNELFASYIPGKSPKDLDEMEAKQLAIDALQRIADVESRYIEWRQSQADRDDKFAMRLQALEETRHQETRRDMGTQTFWQTASPFLAAVIASLLTALFTWLLTHD